MILFDPNTSVTGQARDACLPVGDCVFVQRGIEPRGEGDHAGRQRSAQVTQPCRDRQRERAAGLLAPLGLEERVPAALERLLVPRKPHAPLVQAREQGRDRSSTPKPTRSASRRGHHGPGSDPAAVVGGQGGCSKHQIGNPRKLRR